MNSTKSARERSVGSLQMLYTVVVSIALTESLRRLVSVIEKNSFLNWYDNLLMFLSFAVTVIPFYHGANRYLDSTYVTNEKQPKQYALLIDFLMLFTEGLLLFILAMTSDNPMIFYSLLAGLFIFDAGWVGLTRLIKVDEEAAGPKYLKWAGINVFAAILIFVFVWSRLFSWELWLNPYVKNIALFLVAIVRTIYDYRSVWSFYYPKEDGEEEEYNDIPAPRPAPPPSRYRRQ